MKKTFYMAFMGYIRFEKDESTDRDVVVYDNKSLVGTFDNPAMAEVCLDERHDEILCWLEEACPDGCLKEDKFETIADPELIARNFLNLDGKMSGEVVCRNIRFVDNETNETHIYCLYAIPVTLESKYAQQKPAS